MSTTTLNAFGGSYHFQPKAPSRNVTGLAVVVGLHVVVGYALMSGLAQKVVKVIKKPLEAAVIQEVTLPPPPPPPKVVKVEQAPKTQTPPPAYVPPPEVVPQPSAPVLSSTTATPPPEPVIAPPAPAPVPAAPPAPPKQVRADIGASCPGQVRPDVPRGAEGVSGVVKAQALIRDGVVKDVTILSGPKVFHAAVRSAMLQYKCVSTGDGEILATQQFVFEAN
ncbi:energy transducer TonB [Zoogloea sp.]|uniref:energy transducer TonB n=1 Tax=Zoogloea sp. TaxID=49181 RepID=UPI0035B21839